MGIFFAWHGVDFDEMQVGAKGFLDDCAVGSGGEDCDTFDSLSVMRELNKIHFGSVNELSGEGLACREDDFGLVFVLVTDGKGVFVVFWAGGAESMD